MAMGTVDLWGAEIGTTAKRTPLALLNEQAALLAEKTRGLLEAFVRVRPQGEGNVLLTFRIRANALNYTYNLFAISHDMELYPVRIEETTTRQMPADVLLKTEEDLKQFVREQLSAERTTTIVNNLLAQVQDYRTQPAQ